ncbi:MAG TPA: hypothetical protein PKI46_08480 [Bacteroidales bacterium]|nr:hypothetical protein [Bacteroidales bacterium]
MKGYIKISSSGASQLTMNGKNVAIQIEKQLSNKFWSDPRVKKESIG